MAQWRALLAECPEVSGARAALGEVHLALGQWPEVEAVLARLEADSPGSLEAALLRGRACLARRDFASARRVLGEAAERFPGEVGPRVLLSYAFLQEDSDPAGAERALEAVLALEPANAEARHNLALLRHRRAG
jgi:Flp pilus assembly protein TadD